MIGATVSRYKVLSKLGGGGMGVVYEAEDLELGRRVAIKFLPEADTKDHALDRFRREARATSWLNHPHICTVYDVGSYEDRPFLVMERLSGKTLKHLLADQRLPVEQVVRLGEQIADALVAAHREGIVHRDLKPANLFVTDRGEAKVLDFGLAKFVALEAGADPHATTEIGFKPDRKPLKPRRDDFKTQSGLLLGTAAYMSPEQICGEELDGRSDLFSLGVVLYEMATGQLPFVGATLVACATAILQEQPKPPRDLRPELPAALEQIVLKALAKDVAERYPSAVAMQADLAALRRELVQAASSSPRTEKDEARVVRRRRQYRPGKNSLPAEVWDRSSIAVLPFVDMSPNKDQEYLSDGIAEELLNLLAKIPALRVISRSSAFSYKGKEKKVAEIARELGVAHVLEGSLRKSGDKVRISAQLIEAKSDSPLWSMSYDRDLGDIFAIEDEIAADVVKHLEVALLGSLPRSTDIAPQVYPLLLEARRWSRLSSGPAWEEANALYEKVIAVDPRCVAAYVELAQNFGRQLTFGLRPSSELVPRVKEYLHKALAMDPEHAKANALIGTIALIYERDPAEAARSLGLSLAREPLNPEILTEGAWLLASLNRIDKAIQTMHLAIPRDPVNPMSHQALGVYHLFGRNWDRAIASFHTVLRLNPGAVGVHHWIGVALLYKGELEAAFKAMLEEKLEIFRLLGLVLAHHALGRKEQSDAALEVLLQKYEQEKPYFIAAALAYRNERERSFEWLAKSAAAGDMNLTWILPDALLESLHEDSRWLPFLGSIGKSPRDLDRIRFEVSLPQ